MWPFSKKKNKENILDKVRKLTKEGKEKAIRETVENLMSSIIKYAKKGKTSITEEIDESIKDEVLRLIKEEGFEARVDCGCGWYIRISW